MAETPRIYVACLAAYNAGKLHGDWIEATQTAAEIEAEIRSVLSRSPEPGAEEWAIHDYEGFCGARIGEYESIANVAAIGAFIKEHGELGGALLGHLGDLDDAKRALEEQHAGSGSSLADWAEEFLADTGALQGMPEHLRPYFDFDRYSHDLELGGDVFSIDVDGTVHVFWSR
ncbi:MAG: antirestriction protein ArdA [Myxococcota bacterium]